VGHEPGEKRAGGGSDLKTVMDRMGHAQITTTQKYLHTLPDADAENLHALNRTRGQHGGAGNGKPSDIGPPTRTTASDDP
jgi:hypothetical protein